MKTVRLAIKLSLYVAITMLAVNAIRIAIPKAKAQVASVVPYTVVLAETIVHDDGRRQAGPSQTWAVRSDGSVAATLGANSSGRQIRFASGIHVMVSDKLRAKSTTQRPVEDSWVLDPGERCIKTITGKLYREGLNAPVVEQISGYRAVKVSWGSTADWFALDHGCALIKRKTDFADRGASELELVSLIAGEPSNAFFALPEAYQEGPPSSLSTPASERKNCDPACQESQKAHFERLDKSYYTHRVQ